MSLTLRRTVFLDGALVKRAGKHALGARASIAIDGGFSGWRSWLALALAMKGFVTFPYPYSKGGNLGFL